MSVRDRRLWMGWVVLAAVYGAWATLRWRLVPGLDFDEAEQMLHLQRLRLGYGPQPPLFEWLLWALHTVTRGPALLLLALLKAALFVLLALATASAVRTALADARTEVAAGWWVLTLAPLLWDAPRTLTHSLLAATCIAGVVALSMPLLTDPDRALPRTRWFGIGLTACAALLAKYNTALVLVGFGITICAGWWLRQRSWHGWRRCAAMHVRGLPWVMLGLLPFVLHLVWISAQYPLVIAPIQSKMQTSRQTHLAWSLAQEWLSTVGSSLLVAVAAVVWALRHRSAVQGKPPASASAKTASWFWLNLLLIYMVALLLLIAALAFGAGLRNVHVRWLLPMAVPAAILAAIALLTRWATAARPLGRLSAVAVVVALALLVLRPTLLAQQGHSSWSQLPSAQVSVWLDTLGARDTIIVSRPMHLAGALAMVRADAEVVYPGASSLAFDAQTPMCTWWWVGTHPLVEALFAGTDWGYRVATPAATMRWHHLPDQRAAATLYAQRIWTERKPCATLGELYDRMP